MAQDIKSSVPIERYLNIEGFEFVVRIAPTGIYLRRKGDRRNREDRRSLHLSWAALVAAAGEANGMNPYVFLGFDKELVSAKNAKTQVPG